MNYKPAYVSTQKRVVSGRIEIYDFSYLDNVVGKGNEIVVAHFDKGVTKLHRFKYESKTPKSLLTVVTDFTKENGMLEKWSKFLGRIVGWDFDQADAQGLILDGKFSISKIPAVIWEDYLPKAIENGNIILLPKTKALKSSSGKSSSPKTIGTGKRKFKVKYKTLRMELNNKRSKSINVNADTFADAEEIVSNWVDSNNKAYHDKKLYDIEATEIKSKSSGKKLSGTKSLKKYDTPVKVGKFKIRGWKYNTNGNAVIVYSYIKNGKELNRSSELGGSLSSLSASDYKNEKPSSKLISLFESEIVGSKKLSGIKKFSVGDIVKYPKAKMTAKVVSVKDGGFEQSLKIRFEDGEEINEGSESLVLVKKKSSGSFRKTKKPTLHTSTEAKAKAREVYGLKTPKGYILKGLYTDENKIGALFQNKESKRVHCGINGKMPFCSKPEVTK